MKKLLVDLAGLCVFVRRCRKHGGAWKDEEVVVVMLDPGSTTGDHGHGGSMKHPAHFPHLTMDLEHTESEPDQIVMVPGGKSLGIWSLKGVEVNMPAAGSKGLKVIENVRKGDRPGNDPESRDFSWVPDLEKAVGPCKVNRKAVTGSLAGPFTSRVRIQAGTLEAAMEPAWRSQIWTFVSDTGRTGYAQALTDRVLLTVEVPDSERLISLPLGGKTVGIRFDQAAEVRIAMACYPTERGQEPGGEEVRMHHFAALYDVVLKKDDTSFRPRERSVPVSKKGSVASTSAVHITLPRPARCSPGQVLDPSP